MIARPQRDTAITMDRGFADPLGVMAAFSRDLAASQDLDSALSTLLGGVMTVLGAGGAGVYAAAEGVPLTCRVILGDMGSVGLASSMDTGLLRRCLRRGTPECAYRRAPGGTERDASSLLCVPLLLDDRRLGVVAVANKQHGIFQSRDVNLLEAMAGPLALALANEQLTRALERQEGVSRELELAAEIQRSLLPDADLRQSPVIGLNRPIRKVSGDFFDFFPLDGERIPFALADVSGKGMNAALLMAKAAGLFRCLAKDGGSPGELLSAINREICETASRGMFVTMVAGTYESATGSLCFANAGHEPPLLRAPDRSYRSFPAAEPPLGILPDLSFEDHEITLDGGEFFIFSDGLTEYRYGSEEALGVEGLIQLFESMAELPLDHRLRTLLAELDREGWEARDDLTVLAIDDTWVGRND